MNIPFIITRSRFLNPCKQGIQSQAAAFAQGQFIHIPLGSGGIDGDVTITLQSPTASTFNTNWSGSTATWFPVCIRAAATALRDCGFSGRFDISHQ